MQKVLDGGCNASEELPGSGNPRVVLTIAGFDPSSGAGITADLKVFAAHGLYGVACATALTVQSTQGVRRSESVGGELIGDTLRCLSDDIEIAGVKIGMLGTRAAVETVAEWLRTQPLLPVVLDPVVRSSSGADLLSPDGIDALRTELLPLVTVLTPNLAEAELLSGTRCEQREDVPEAARALLRLTGGSVAITGGHLAGAPEDYLLEAGQPDGTWFGGEWVRTQATHGTGCAFSSALLCELVGGAILKNAVPAAKRYVESAMRAASPVGRGKGPMHHLFAFDSPANETSNTRKPSQ